MNKLLTACERNNSAADIARFCQTLDQVNAGSLNTDGMDLNNLKTLRDEDLEPDEGSVNPFRQVVTEDQKNYYTATLMFSPPPTRLPPNTSYVGLRKDGLTENKFVMNLLRMYHVDAGNGPGSGGVPLPALSIYNADGDLVKHFDECDLFAPGVPELRTEQVFPAMPVIDHRPRNGESPATPGKQVRLYNLCTYNFWNGGATHCVLENQLRQDDEGFYTLVISSTKNRPNNLVEHAASWLDWGPYLDGQLQYRYVYRENPIVSAIAAAADGKAIPSELQPYVPVAAPCDTETFEKGGWGACFRLGSE